MRRYAVLVAAVSALAVLAPMALAGEPNGLGLFREHESHCTGAVTYDGLVTLVPGNGTSFWVAGHHLVIQSVVITPTGGEAQTYVFGQKKGQMGETVVCEGDFPGYHVKSYDVLVP